VRNVLEVDRGRRDEPSQALTHHILGAPEAHKVLVNWSLSEICTNGPAGEKQKDTSESGHPSHIQIELSGDNGRKCTLQQHYCAQHEPLLHPTPIATPSQQLRERDRGLSDPRPERTTTNHQRKAPGMPSLDLLHRGHWPRS
jgi:hypothetical protein